MSNPNPSPATRFQSGRSGNPTGKRKGTRSVVAELRDILDATAEGQAVPNARRLAQLAFDLAMTGDFRFVEFVVSKTESSILADAIEELKEIVYAERGDAAAGSDGDEVDLGIPAVGPVS